MMNLIQGAKLKALSGLSLALILTACSEPASEFEQRIAKPWWFFYTGSQVLNNERDVRKLWGLQGDRKIFYKSCYQAIQAHSSDDSLVVRCLYLMSAGIQSDKQRQVKQRRMLLDNYPLHNDDLSFCGNCMVGDTVARNAQRLAYSERYHTGIAESVLVLERMLDQREQDVSLWVQAEVYQDLMRYYGEVNFTPERRLRIQTAFIRLKQAKAANQALADRFAKLEKAYQALMH